MGAGLRANATKTVDRRARQSQFGARVSLNYGKSVVAMTIKENDAMTMKKNDEYEQARCPDPEEGYRLMRAFLSIKQAALRQAVVKMVTELAPR